MRTVAPHLKLKEAGAALLMAALLTLVPGCGKPASPVLEPIIFTTFVEFPEELPRFRVMIESLRTFGGRYKDAPVWAYVADELLESNALSLDALKNLGAKVRRIAAPEDVTWYFFVRKVFAAAHAETDAKGKAELLARLDPDTIFIQEPAEFILAAGKALGYRPAFHRNICPLFDEPLDDYWSRAYKLMGIEKRAVFPMVTPADEDRIRPYFQSGCIVVRPERGLMKNWKRMLLTLARDAVIKEVCEKDRGKRTFTFQVALIGSILNTLRPDEMHLFSDKINYPIFFREMYGGKKDFHDITGVVTVRYEHFFQYIQPGWDKRLQGPADRVAWIKERFGRKD